MTDQVKEVFQRIQSSPDVTGVMLITNDGIPLQTTVDSDTTVQYGGLVSQLSNKTRTVVKEMDKKNDLTCIRVQSTKFELLTAPDDTYILIVQQNKEKDEEEPKAESQEEG